VSKVVTPRPAIFTVACPVPTRADAGHAASPADRISSSLAVQRPGTVVSMRVPAGSSMISRRSAGGSPSGSPAAW
jgi:hypothetical protein